jgi:hypothetical protein
MKSARLFLAASLLALTACASWPPCRAGYEPPDAYELDCYEIRAALNDPRVSTDVKKELRDHLKK